MLRAMERHNAGDTRILPIILRPCDWKATPFGSLLAMPKDGKPVVKWPDLDEAFLEIVNGIKRALAEMGATTAIAAQAAKPNTGTATIVDAPRSANLRIRQEFSDADKDGFVQEAFE